MRHAPCSLHAYHLYVVKISATRRDDLFKALRGQGIGLNVHYVPVHFHPFYREHYGTGPGMCPVAERSYEEILTLPLFPDMTNDDVETVVGALVDTINRFSR